LTPDKPPGLTQTLLNKNLFDAIGEEREELSDQQQRCEDLKSMENRTDEGEFPKVAMGNYSKRSRDNLKAPKFKKLSKENVKVGLDKLMTLDMFLKEPAFKELNPVITEKQDQGWVYVKGVVDSGASASVAHPGLCPEYPVNPSAGSRSGQRFVSASGDVIENLGEQCLDVVTEDGSEGQVLYQSADVARPLNSVTELCDAGGKDGQLVVFSKWGGMIWNPATNRRVPFQREDGVYQLGFWVKPKKKEGEASGFTRQGS
jgi:hypothetical protein